MDPWPVISALNRRGCRFVVVGSAARQLTGEHVEPADLDVVVDGSTSNRDAVIGALVDIDAQLLDGDRLRPITPSSALPWDWSWTVVTYAGPIDMIVRFIDGTDFEHHDRKAANVMMIDGSNVRCRPTRHVA